MLFLRYHYQVIIQQRGNTIVILRVYTIIHVHSPHCTGHHTVLTRALYIHVHICMLHVCILQDIVAAATTIMFLH